jgi:DNA-binding IclR family transcriptional regulator
MLTCFERDGEVLGLGEFTKRLGIRASTAHRFASTLKYSGFLQQDPKSGEYGLGLKILELSRLVINGIPLRRLALPHLATLAQKSGGNANLGILADDAVLYLARVPSPRIQDTYFHTGRKAGLHCTALGKVLLAFLPSDDLLVLLNRIGLKPATGNTITDPTALSSHLEYIRLRGFATDNEEYMLGSHCIAAPVRGSDGTTIAAISISTTLLDMSHEELQRHLPILLDAVRATSSSMGSYLP